MMVSSNLSRRSFGSSRDFDLINHTVLLIIELLRSFTWRHSSTHSRSSLFFVRCVIVMDRKVISCGRNRTNETRNATRHAEIEAIDVLLDQWKEIKLSQAEVSKMFTNCYLYVTCEPCIMCATALSFLGIKEVYYGCANDKFGGCGSILSLHKSDKTSCEEVGGKSYKCTGGIMAEEAVSLFRNFYELGNPNAPKPHRPIQQP
ncbi:hypothetical protein SSX86_018539 [Deinandra increscens subsp. villosa]|uniref:CMP/dCMP-type deaminase domain-containing protein n=1 Tax=Deinandra increscens subsp. villosa TaxID=3103831 RepID=A0AAP0CXY7_9ASTR